MYTKRTDSFAMTPCWYSREHVPAGRRQREEDGSLVCTCRYCRKQIRSRGNGAWALAEGLDLDALAASCMSSHFAVVDEIDAIVVARYPLPDGADKPVIEAIRQSICEKHGIDEDGDLVLRLVSHDDVRQRHH